MVQCLWWVNSNIWRMKSKIYIILTGSGLTGHWTLSPVSRKQGSGLRWAVSEEESGVITHSPRKQGINSQGRSSTRHDLVKHVGSEDERSHSNFSLLFPFRNMKRLNYFSPRSVCVRPDCDPGQVRDLVITKLVTQSRSRGILSPADRHTLKQKLHPDPFIIIVFNGHVVCSCDGIISKWSPGANIIVSCSDN